MAELNYNGNELRGGVYIIINSLNYKFYIGSTVGFKRRWNEHTKYLQENRHENKFLQNAFNKHGTDVFVFELLEIVNGDFETIRATEQRYLDRFWDNKVNCYNISKVASAPMSGRHHTEEAKKKISESQKRLGYKPPSNKGKHHTEAHKQKLREALKGHLVANETRKKISEAKKGKIPWNKGKTCCYSQEIRKKMSEACKGKRHSEETKRKMSEAHKGNKYALGKHHHKTEEHKRKISEALKSRALSKNTKEISVSKKGQTPWNK